MRYVRISLHVTAAGMDHARGSEQVGRDYYTERLLALSGNWHLIHCMFAFAGEADIDNHGALTICLHAGGNPASVKTGLGLRGGGCSVDSLNQKSSSLPQPSLGSGGAGGLHSALSAGQAIWI